LTIFFAGSFWDLLEGGKGVSLAWTDRLMSVLFQLEKRNKKKNCTILGGCWWWGHSWSWSVRWLIYWWVGWNGMLVVLTKGRGM
jgi:hypothetical protein